MPPERYGSHRAFNSPVLQNARPCVVVALASYTGVDKITKNTVGFARKDI